MPKIEVLTTIVCKGNFGAMLWLGGKANTIREGIEKCKVVIANVKAFDKFRELVKRQGGDPSSLDNPQNHLKPKYSVGVRSNSSGFVAGFRTMDIGLLAIDLGAGRMKVDDVIDMKAGIVLMKKIGDPVAAGELLAIIFTDRGNVLESAQRRLGDMILISEDKPSIPKTILSFDDETGASPWE